jgi:two-component system NarL family response regulator
MSGISAIVIDRHTIFRDGLAKLLKDHPAFARVHACGNICEGVRQARDLKPAILLCDTDFPESDCMLALDRLRDITPSTRVLMLTHSTEERTLFLALKAGASGYLSKDVDFDTLVSTVLLVVSGGVVFSDKVAEMILGELSSSNGHAEQAEDNHVVHGLSKRELDVLREVAKGASNREIANILFISENTVKVHLRNIMDKLRVHHRAQLVAYGNSVPPDTEPGDSDSSGSPAASVGADRH